MKNPGALILLILFLTVTQLYGQRMEVFGGGNRNSFFHTNENAHSSSFSSAYGFSLGVGIDSLVSGIFKTRLTLQFDSYGGYLDVSSGGTSGAQHIQANVRKSVLALTYFPFSFRFWKKLDFNLGLEYSRLIQEKFSGTESGFNPYNPGYKFDLTEKYNRLSTKATIGLKVRLAYDFYLSKTLAICPEYMSFVSLSPEFEVGPASNVKTFRQFACIGIRKKLNRKKL